MRISTRGRYALQAMVVMAGSEGEDSLRLRDIAQRAGISENYLEQLFIQLKEHGLVRGIQGANGGYVLARPDTGITAGDVLRAVESSFNPVTCLGEEKCNREEICITRLVWKGLQDRIFSVVDGKTLADLAAAYRAMPETTTEPDFVI